MADMTDRTEAQQAIMDECDSIKRLLLSNDVSEDTVADLIGYLILLRIATRG